MLKNIKKILIANRGEIACRIIKSAKLMQIDCVCVYSDADSNSLHVKMADEAVYIGAPPSMQSYLDIEKITMAALKCKADAVHPGYGFLSENAKLPIALSEAGIRFIGPSAKNIELMASKIKAKEIANAAGVNLIPGYIGVISNPREAIDIANSIGFPVMLKAVAGGGGKGMRIVNSAQEMTLAFESATKEAEKSAGDGSIFIEKYITSPRHIEMQMIADKHSNIVCLNERECSIQRKNQKVIEESPSSFMTDEMRQDMMNQCINLFRKVNYHSVGTVEFVVDDDRNFYFLEVNTRLQVEHPVTELVTGIDLVREMIQIEDGLKLSFRQEDIVTNGWAFEARVYAENPEKNFMPSTGRLSYYREPLDSSGIRIDSGVYEGHDVTTFYDPMIAKICSHGKNRIEAIYRMQHALERFYISGIEENLDFLQSVFRNNEFINGNIQTNFIEKHYHNKFKPMINLSSTDRRMFSLAALFLYMNDKLTYANRDKCISGLYTIVINDIEKNVHCTLCNKKLTITDEHGTSIVYENKCSHYWGSLDLIINDENVFFKISQTGEQYELRTRGMLAKCFVYRATVAELRKFVPMQNKQKAIHSIISPISGVVTAWYLKSGDFIDEGQHICTIEAMKMENLICSDQGDIIASTLCVSVGDSIKSGDVLMKVVPSNNSR